MMEEISQYDEFAETWAEDESGGHQTRLLWHLFGYLNHDEVLFELSDGSVFVGVIGEETEDAFHFVDVSPADELVEHAYLADQFTDGQFDPDPAGWIDERLGEHRAVIEDRATVDSKRISRGNVEKMIRKRR